MSTATLASRLVPVAARTAKKIPTNIANSSGRVIGDEKRLKHR